MRINSFLLICTAFIFCTCGKKVPPPAYLKIDNFILQKNPDATSNQGEMSANFTDAWVYIDEQLIGVFQLPAILPIGQSGAHKITVIAGVRTNGISATKEKYPFVQNYETNAYLSENDTAEVTPTTMYYPNLSFWIEDFEDPTSVELTETIYSKAHLATSSNTDYLKYGAFFGLVQLNATDSIWEANTTGQLSIPLGKEVFLEVDYYLTTNVTTGLTAYNISAQTETPHPYIQLNAEQSSTVVWKKIYIDLHEISDYESTANYFELAFSSILAVNLKSDAVICIDNIKVIHN